MTPETCVLCGCSDDRPCLGGTVFASVLEARHVHRLVADVEVLPPGETCAWLPMGLAVCSAHTDGELEALEQRVPDPYRRADLEGDAGEV